ncbi:hypothetical protein [Saccharothrix syringae]|uniref:PPE domain-containing protein n=1 Tax=Saccharothrix syringae TaxID=103733 RepID=A0A5Q0GU70_SACSY|nr:hypothetical protein [Saccharothrix syringae]QFZ17636.1 hypothetical protein EKG83_09215 [Saccharothrix syringae]
MTHEKPPVPEPTANYPAYQHADMKRQVEENFNPGAAGEIAEEWKSIGETFTQLAVDFRVIVSGSESGWTGSAGEGVRTALAKVGDFSDLTGDHFTATGTALHDQTTAAAEAKSRMPDPVDYDPKKMFTDAISSGSLVELAALPVTMPLRKAESEEAKAEAVRVMQARDDAMRSATSSMPAFAETPTVTRDQGTATSTSQTSSTSTHTVDPGTRSGSTETPNTGRTDPSGTTTPSWTAPPTLPPPSATPPVTLPQPPPSAPPTQPPWLAPPGTRPPGSGPTAPPRRPVPPPPGLRPPGGGNNPPGRGPGGGPRAGGGPGGGGRPGVPTMPGTGGRGGAPGGFGPLGGGGQSGFGPNSPNNPNSPQGPNGPNGPAGTPRQGGPAGQGGRGPTNTPGTPAATGAGAGQGAEDQEHKAKYLIPTDDYFDDNRLVAPPTIGE